MATQAAADYPVYYAVSDDNTMARWRPFVQWIMAIPHFMISSALNPFFPAVIAWFAIMFTGKMPPGLANLMIMLQRYNARVNGFALGLTEHYPPFDYATTAGDPGDYAIRLDVNPELENRNRLTVFFRLFMLIPIAIFAMIVFIGVYIVAIIAWFAVIVTGEYPAGMRNFVIKGMRLAQRITGYAYLLTDQYPPFSLD